VSEDLVLVPEVEARRALRDRRIRLQVLAPHGVWTGCGALRVLRLKATDDGEREVELTVGYESYQP
jgi:hypothetical protein